MSGNVAEAKGEEQTARGDDLKYRTDRGIRPTQKIPCNGFGGPKLRRGYCNGHTQRRYVAGCA